MGNSKEKTPLLKKTGKLLLIVIGVLLGIILLIFTALYFFTDNPAENEGNIEGEEFIEDLEDIPDESIYEEPVMVVGDSALMGEPIPLLEPVEEFVSE